MTVFYVFAVLLFLFIAVGIAMVCAACGRVRVPDYWDPAVQKQKGYEYLSAEIADGRAFITEQESAGNLEHVEILSYDGLRLHGMLVGHENARGTILMMHGWRSSWKLDFSCAMSFYYSSGFNLLIPDQRAHGQSGGHFITFGVRESRDVLSWAVYAGQRFGKAHPVFLTGISMGAASVLMAADGPFEENVRGIIADCGFSDPYEILRSVLLRADPHLPVRFLLGWMGLFTRPVAGFGLKERSTVTAAAKSGLPIILLHGLRDTFVPPHMSEEVAAACGSRAELLLVQDAWHGMSFIKEPERCKKAISAFLDRNLK